MKVLSAPDGSAHFLLDAIASLHKVPIKGEPRDQTKVTAVHTAIESIGGQTHHTAIPWDQAEKAFLEFHTQSTAAPPPDPPPAQ